MLASRLNGWRLLAAVVTVPLVDAVLGYLAFPLILWLGSHGSYRIVSPENPALTFAGIAGVFGLFVMITAALPVTVWLIRREQTSLHHFVLAGAGLGNLLFAFYLLIAVQAMIMHLVSGTLGEHLSPVMDVLAGAARAIAFGSTIGAASGAMVWLLAVPKPAPHASERAFDQL